jgi:hypothetical protein
MPKPVCVPCQRFFRPLRNGVTVQENMPIGTMVPAGLEAPELWKPYKAWQADTWECQGCGAVIANGFGLQPLWERHHQEKMPEAEVQVNDC